MFYQFKIQQILKQWYILSICWYYKYEDFVRPFFLNIVYNKFGSVFHYYRISELINRRKNLNEKSENTNFLLWFLSLLHVFVLFENIDEMCKDNLLNSNLYLHRIR